MINSLFKIAIFTTLSINVFAETRYSQEIFKTITIRQEQCDKEFSALISKYFPAITAELKEIHKDSFRLRTQAENSLDEWAMFTSNQNYYRVQRHFDFEDTNPSNDRCYTTITYIQ